jgi:hypothetical protein
MADDNVIPIRGARNPPPPETRKAKRSRTKKGPRLTDKFVEQLLEDQRYMLFEVVALIETTAQALRHQFGDWPSDIPEYPRTLARACTTVSEVINNLDSVQLMRDALQRAAEKGGES